MAEVLFGVSQSSLLLHPKIGFSCGRAISPGLPSPPSNPVGTARYQLFGTSFGSSRLRSVHRNPLCAAIVSDTKASNTFTVDSENKEVEIESGTGVESDTGGGDGDGFGDRGDSGGGGGRGGDSNRDKGDGDGESHEKSEKKMALSMSQKLTLGYAALVGVGGLMGYLKSGSQKSLLAGGISASLLYYVHTQLPTNPVFASTLGLGLSAALLGVMGSRFKSSGKIFPAGVVSLVSLVMTGGYLHGILRSAH
ncbi:UPF0136 membrane protein [Morus notabilis]|uniref:UPF0136 membrane protein n=1 Tax=Morus notabilis TaxID=981085 RepID=W9S3X9_9ROSA|nr:protein FATTY ACID EXPORT 2, chloroplastic [Morus notabilis]EXC13625.1 UPF0136 membrane protein [Morus notabilis]